MSAQPSIVYVVDDDASIRQSIESLLRSVGHTVAIFDSSDAFARHPRSDLAACLVLDVRLPGRSGLEFQRELDGLGIDMPVIFVTGHGNIAMSVTAMKAGAIEFLTKPFRDQDLLDAVHRGLALARERRMEAAISEELQARVDTLTPREREVMALVSSGLLNKQIAARLALSEATVKVHRAQVMRKMAAGSLPELVRIADRVGTPPPKA